MDMMNYVKHVWSMLDNLAEDNPESYRQFINKQLLEGSKTCDLPQPRLCIQTSPVSSVQLEHESECVNNASNIYRVNMTRRLQGEKEVGF